MLISKKHNKFTVKPICTIIKQKNKGSSPVIRSKALLKKQGSFFCLNAEKHSVYAAFWDCAF